jgi:hypothetical protein
MNVKVFQYLLPVCLSDSLSLLRIQATAWRSSTAFRHSPVAIATSGFHNTLDGKFDWISPEI